MKKVSSLLLGLALSTALFYSCKKDEKDPLATSTASTDPARGLAIQLADLSQALSDANACQLNFSKLLMVGKPLTEADIEYFDPSTGHFKLKVSQYDWLGENKEIIQKARVKGGGYYAITLTLDGNPVFGGVVLSGYSSLACSKGQPFFLEDATYSAPNPGPNPRTQNSYVLPLMDNAPVQRIPQLDAALLARLEKIGKLKK